MKALRVSLLLVFLGRDARITLAFSSGTSRTRRLAQRPPAGFPKDAYKPKQFTKSLLKVLSDRNRDILEKRYGLNKTGDRFTLEAIGQSYGITRERVRQLQNFAIQLIQKSDVYKQQNDLMFTEMHKLIDGFGGGVMAEHVLLDELTDDPQERNHACFLLGVDDLVHKRKISSHFSHRWYTEQKVADHVETALQNLHKGLDRDELVSESEIVNRFRSKLGDMAADQDGEVLMRWLQMSRKIGRNPLGDWGPADSGNIRATCIRDCAYLAVRRHGSPMDFQEVTRAIDKLFGREYCVSSVLNCLFSDDRFVRVGRGLYALAEWGYRPGVVKDVLKDILENEGPLSIQEIIDKVRKERCVKDSTILANLSDKLFKRLKNGTYTLAS